MAHSELTFWKKIVFNSEYQVFCILPSGGKIQKKKKE